MTRAVFKVLICLCYSGLGTSSILAGAILACLWKITGHVSDVDSLLHGVRWNFNIYVDKYDIFWLSIDPDVNSLLHGLKWFVSI